MAIFKVTLRRTSLAHPAEDGSAVLAGLLDALLVAAVGADDFGDVVPLQDVVLVGVVAEAALVRLPAARSLKIQWNFVLCQMLELQLSG